MSLRSVAGTAVAVAVLTAGCASDSPVRSAPSAAPSSSSTPAPTPGPVSGRYVAIGDSYAADPGISPVDSGSLGCLRSAANYPSLLAAQLRTTVVDVSCSGATTTTVTVGVGGNDGGLFQMLLQFCSQGASTCKRYVDGQAPNILAMTTTSIKQVLDQVAMRAPDAHSLKFQILLPSEPKCRSGRFVG